MLVFTEQTAFGKEHSTLRALKPFAMNLPHVLPQFAGAFQWFQALFALVRSHVSMRLQMFREVVLALERPRADDTRVWTIVAVRDQMATQVVSKQEVTSTDKARVREFHTVFVVCAGVFDHVFT